MRATTRISIRWLPEPASEPTDTLVLSLGNYYVDLRVTKANQSIDWALAGQEVVISEEPLNIKFNYLIDSRCLQPGKETEYDLGQFVKLPNGDDLETGEMAAAHLGGQVMPYEEVWHELDSTTDTTSDGPVTGIPNAFILESLDQDMPRQQVPNSARPNTKTTYARVGQFFLAMRRTTIASVQGEGPASYAYAAIRQYLDDKSYRWTTKSIFGDVSGMWTMSDEDGNDSAEGKAKSSWNVGEVIFFGGDKIGEHCTVRAVSQ